MELANCQTLQTFKVQLWIVAVIFLMPLIQLTDSQLSCGSQFDDIQSRTYRSEIVFQGYYQGKYGHDETTRGGGYYQAYFSVTALLKGQLPQEYSGDFLPVVVGYFGAQINVAECIAPGLRSDVPYLVFLQGKRGK